MQKTVKKIESLLDEEGIEYNAEPSEDQRHVDFYFPNLPINSIQAKSVNTDLSGGFMRQEDVLLVEELSEGWQDRMRRLLLDCIKIKIDQPSELCHNAVEDGIRKTAYKPEFFEIGDYKLLVGVSGIKEDSMTDIDFRYLPGKSHGKASSEHNIIVINSHIDWDINDYISQLSFEVIKNISSTEAMRIAWMNTVVHEIAHIRFNHSQSKMDWVNELEVSQYVLSQSWSTIERKVVGALILENLQSQFHDLKTLDKQL